MAQQKRIPVGLTKAERKRANDFLKKSGEYQYSWRGEGKRKKVVPIGGNERG